MEVFVIRQNGWEKSIKLGKAITRVGSSPGSDIQLESVHILPLHLQILYSQDTPSSCKVLNLGGDALLRVSGMERKLAKHVAVELHDGDEITLEGHTLAIRIPLRTGVLRSSQFIGASLMCSQAVLQMDIPVVARLALKNMGDNSACQFQVDLKGLPADCYQIDPPPLLYPGGEEDVRIQFFHRCRYPAAGFQEITIVVSAPATYPGEQIVIQQGLYVSPVFDQFLEIQDDVTKNVILKFDFPTKKTALEPLPQIKDNSTKDTQLAVSNNFSPVSPTSQTKTKIEDKVSIKPRVVGSTSESYWDENSS